MNSVFANGEFSPGPHSLTHRLAEGLLFTVAWGNAGRTGNAPGHVVNRGVWPTAIFNEAPGREDTVQTEKELRLFSASLGFLRRFLFKSL